MVAPAKSVFSTRRRLLIEEGSPFCESRPANNVRMRDGIDEEAAGAYGFANQLSSYRFLRLHYHEASPVLDLIGEIL